MDNKQLIQVVFQVVKELKEIRVEFNDVKSQLKDVRIDFLNEQQKNEELKEGHKFLLNKIMSLLDVQEEQKEQLEQVDQQLDQQFKKIFDLSKNYGQKGYQKSLQKLNEQNKLQYEKILMIEKAFKIKRPRSSGVKKELSKSKSVFFDEKLDQFQNEIFRKEKEQKRKLKDYIKHQNQRMEIIEDQVNQSKIEVNWFKEKYDMFIQKMNRFEALRKKMREKNLDEKKSIEKQILQLAKAVQKERHERKQLQRSIMTQRDNFISLDEKQPEQKSSFQEYSQMFSSQLNQLQSDFMNKVEVLGDKKFGQTVISAASWQSDEHGKSYVHIKLPLKVDTDNKYFYIHARGYVFWEKALVRATFAGYCYKNGNKICHRVASGTHQPTVYKGSDQHVYCRLSLRDKFGTTIVIDTTSVGIKSGIYCIKRGEIEIIASEEETL